jgi:hypothetical protein
MKFSESYRLYLGIHQGSCQECKPDFPCDHAEELERYIEFHAERENKPPCWNCNERPQRAKGLCMNCYGYRHRNGRLPFRTQQKGGPRKYFGDKCGCGRPAVALEMCNRCYQANRRGHRGVVSPRPFGASDQTWYAWQNNPARVSPGKQEQA